MAFAIDRKAVNRGVTGVTDLSSFDAFPFVAGPRLTVLWAEAVLPDISFGCAFAFDARQSGLAVGWSNAVFTEANPLYAHALNTSCPFKPAMPRAEAFLADLLRCKALGVYTRRSILAMTRRRAALSRLELRATLALQTDSLSAVQEILALVSQFP